MISLLEFIENSDTEDEDQHLRVSDMKELRNPARPFNQNTSNLDETIISNEDFLGGGLSQFKTRCTEGGGRV